MIHWIERRALRISQNEGIPLYLFTLAASEVAEVAEVARIHRSDAGKLIGYQRPEKRNHVKQIVEYLDTTADTVLFPNALVLALPDTVRFKSSRGPGTTDGLATAGTLSIPVPDDPDQPRPAWIVDGQQRSLALAQTRRRGLPVPIAGFVTDSIAVQRDQFLRVNTVQPLPTSLATELLPELSQAPNSRLAARKLPSALVDMLNTDPQSPFRQLIKRPSMEPSERRDRPVTDTSLVEAIKESLESPSGVLFAYRNMAANTTDTEAIRLILITFWTAVRDTFPEAWGRPSTESRLMHGVGIRAMSRLMDRMMAHVDPLGKDPIGLTRTQLELIAGDCRWDHGTWPELGLTWDALQNTPRHISTLSNLLIRLYMAARQGV